MDELRVEEEGFCVCMRLTKALIISDYHTNAHTVGGSGAVYQNDSPVVLFDDGFVLTFPPPRYRKTCRLSSAPRMFFNISFQCILGIEQRDSFSS